MGSCPFLTTTEKEISCFEECIFYKNENTKEECPFKSVEKLGDDGITKMYYDYFIKGNKYLSKEEYSKGTI
ncbi:hypothetical protein BJV85_003010 [Clostridium acetobutylicum]|uniref:Uncharacterized protein n=1 Tax=Clostridium acetobutylicum (strain ATCC 824 / DSM 792 / JCM 1419 / IAM 19013 / LMG 5710 / NBRC 13948 / NRRL B-527 / VKM B-1787 / 2291 / W) TaxID=272562 RepID=Q97KC3_CLOAB|nr:MULTISPECIES: hypothetical protein [Clostridium]AAK78972.1 Hypothetical protein CA_C0996 [Clostridium acetobutylicum ATCC 824]ADZ20046.1 Conserved hypothetical protein [Clostridium acetobutylicum EA 2018]AEI31542.1 hypothetical protein SMB_G1013 [Clostridium acetobutylicum DSM 1731]AWV81772.1 hypothetical protein DK921_17085 [Clostridium acetobutylicum]MBC2395315.1 hypothetical protein [Clostridium acetobutylicum]